MTISGTRLFADAEVLYATDVNRYLMRGVKVFADAATRDAAYGGAGEPTLYEGETVYLSDSNTLLTYSGTAWESQASRILQVVSTAKTDTFSTSSTSYTDITGLSATITPSSATNTILVVASVIGCTGASLTEAPSGLRLVRGATAIGVGAAAGSRTVTSFASISDSLDYSRLNFTYFPRQVTSVFLDSPATTSATTYKVQMLVTTSTGYINRGATDTDSSAFIRGMSSITLIEVRA